MLEESLHGYVDWINEAGRYRSVTSVYLNVSQCISVDYKIGS